MPTGSLQGRVTATGVGGLAQVAVELAGAASSATVTDADGDYGFADLGPGSYTVSISGYPAGLVFGVEQQAVTISASGGIVTTDFVGAYPPLAITGPPLAAGLVGTAYSGSFTGTGGDGVYSWSVTAGALPTGLVLDAASGAVTGTPTAGGDFAFTVRAESGDQQVDELPVSIDILSLLEVTTASLPDGAVGQPYSTTLAASGGDGVYTWSLASGTLPTGLTLDPATGVIDGTPAETAAASVTIAVSSGDGQALEQAFTLAIRAPLMITTASLADLIVDDAASVVLTATGGDGTFTWAVTTGQLPTGLTLDSGTGEVSGTPTLVGSSDFTIEVTSGDGQTAGADLSWAVRGVLAVTTTTLDNGVVGAAYGHILAATGGDGTNVWTVSSGTLPAGLMLTAATGEISGTPTGTANASFTISVSSGDGQTHEQGLTLDVYEALGFTPTALPGGVVGVAYDETFTPTGGDGAYTWSVTAGGIPSGLSLGASTGVVDGTPTQAGSAIASVNLVSGDGQSITLDVTIPIYDRLAITTTTLPDARLDETYPEMLAATGGDGSLTWSVVGGSVPAGLDLAASGGWTGMPTTPGTASFTVQAVSGDGQTAQQALDLRVRLGYESLCSDYSGSDLASFEDAAIEAAVRSQLGLGAQEDILCGALTGITVLVVHSAGVSSLAGVQNLVALDALDVMDNQVTDLAPIAGLTGLVTLHAEENGLTDLGPLSGLSLAQLFIDDNAISDLSPISGLTLTRLEMDRNAISDLSPLSAMTTLTTLRANENSIATLGPLSGLPLEVLSLRDNSISDLMPLAGISSLDDLILDLNAISDLSPLSGLTGLSTRLSAYGNQISDLTPLAGLTSLEYLRLNDNSINDLSPIANLTALNTLQVADNPVADLSALSTMSGLRTLVAYGAQISDVSVLEPLVQLTYLDLEDNASLSDIQALLNNVGLGSGDSVRLRGTSVGCADVQTLVDAGVTVVSNC